MIIDFKNYGEVSWKQAGSFYGRRSNMTCDSTIFDSVLWGRYYQVAFAETAKAAFMKMNREDIPMAAMPICGEEDFAESFDLLREHFHKDLGQKLHISLADERSLMLLGGRLEDYRVEEAADSFDYVYDYVKMRDLSGKKLHAKKNYVNGFMRTMEGRYEYCELGPEDWKETEAFLDRWLQGREADAQLEAEVGGIYSLWPYIYHLGGKAAGIRVDGRLEAFTIGSYNPVDRMAIIHVEKANAEIRGMYPMISREFLMHEFTDAVFVNREDDLGLPELRKAKESYQPILKVKKYMLWEK